MKWIIALIAIVTVTYSIWHWADQRYQQQLKQLSTPLPAVVSPESGDAHVGEAGDFDQGVAAPMAELKFGAELPAEFAMASDIGTAVGAEQEEAQHPPVDVVDCVLEPTD